MVALEFAQRIIPERVLASTVNDLKDPESLIVQYISLFVAFDKKYNSKELEDLANLTTAMHVNNKAVILRITDPEILKKELGCSVKEFFTTFNDYVIR